MSDLSKNTILYMPDTDHINGVIQVIHGMAEYQGRYRHFAQFLNANGYAVITSDLRGHGNHIARDVELGYFGDNAISRLIGEIHDITAYARTTFPKKPYILFGHGIGALLACIYAKKYDNFIDGLLLSGMPADRRSRIAGSLLVLLFTLMKGEYHRSSLIHSLIMGNYYHAFSKEGSQFAWLSEDSDKVEKYENNPKCGYIYTLNGYKTILDLMDRTYTSGSWIRKNPELPVRLFWGESDSCISGKNDAENVLRLFIENGYEDVDQILFPGQRHELFQDAGSPEVFEEALKQIHLIAEMKGQEIQIPAHRSKHIILEDFVDPEVDRPLIKDDKISLDELISAHSSQEGEDAASTRPKVEMIDFEEIEQMLNETIVTEDPVPSAGSLFHTIPTPADPLTRMPEPSVPEEPEESGTIVMPAHEPGLKPELEPASDSAPEPASDSAPEPAAEVSQAVSANPALDTVLSNLSSEAFQRSAADSPKIPNVFGAGDSRNRSDHTLSAKEALASDGLAAFPNGRRPLDDFDGFKIDPNIMDGL
ncbi:MAG: alpha/beta fold hydrolase [Parasporobacterium sp.]|nr:alpha/beta fold hydrolase [Parasporobacterium sp.]